MNNDFTNKDPLEQGVVIESPELNTGLNDDELNRIIDSRISESKTAYELLRLDERRKTNENYWSGKHYNTDEMVGLPYIDNVIQDNTEKRIALAVGKVPDIIVVPGDGSLEGRQKTEVIERVLDIDISTKEKKRLIKNGLRHNHIYFVGIKKASWNPNKGQFGDYEFNLCDPRKVLISHTGIIPEDGFTTDNCDLIVEVVEEPVAVVMAKFPAKAQQLKELLGSKNDSSRLATTMKYQEGWYTYYNSQGQIVEGVFWRFNHLILRNIHNPYFDFAGYDRVIYDKDGQPKTDAFGQLQTERVFRNFFDRPRKPYILYSYINLGRSPVDDTTAIEQAIPLQRNLNKTGKQIRDISDGITNKYAFNNSITQDQARLVTSNPKEPIWFDNDKPVTDNIQNFVNAGPPAVLFQELIQTRQQIDAKFSIHNLNQASNQKESGVSKQITRENDLVTTDDLSDIVIDRVVEEMGAWAMQFMKLMYVDPHFKSKMGKDGQLIQEFIQRDMIDDGVSVTVNGSTTDKVTARNQAINLGTSGAIDPFTMFEEMDAPNPKERTQRLLLFKMGEGPNGDGFAKYMQTIGVDVQQPQASMPQDPNMPVDPNANPSPPIQSPQADLQPLGGQMPPVPVQ